MHERGVGAAAAPRPRLPEPADRCVDEARVAQREGVVAEATARKGARTVVLKKHVAIVGQAGDQLCALGHTDVNARVALPGVELGVQDTDAVNTRWHAPTQIAAGRLDLDHVGAEVREDAAARWPGDDLREVQNPDALERPW